MFSSSVADLIKAAELQGVPLLALQLLLALLLSCSEHESGPVGWKTLLLQPQVLLGLVCRTELRWPVFESGPGDSLLLLLLEWSPRFLLRWRQLEFGWHPAGFLQTAFESDPVDLVGRLSVSAV